MLTTAFLPYRKLRKFNVHEAMFALRLGATRVKRHASFLPKQLSLFGMQKCLYFEKIGIAFRLQIVHFRLQTCVSITKVAFRFTNATFRITIEHDYLRFGIMLQIS